MAYLLLPSWKGFREKKIVSSPTVKIFVHLEQFADKMGFEV
jgi:hypothetical protein